MDVQKRSSTIQGKATYQKELTYPLRTLILILNSAWPVVLFLLVYTWSYPVLFPTTPLLFALAGTGISLHFLFRFLKIKNLGEWIWSISLLPYPVQKGKNSFLSGFTRLGITLAIGGLSYFTIDRTLLDHLGTQLAPSRSLTQFIPRLSQPEVGRDWAVLPFYFALGAWPKRFEGMPIFYSLPYEKGPPVRFPGHVIARWQMPNTKMIIEGPKSPDTKYSPDELATCFQSSAYSNSRCMAMRKETLSRHLDELKDSGFRPVALEWFEVKNTVLPLSDWPRGLKITAIKGSQIEERMILISSSGTHQAISLIRPKGEKGQKASEVFEQTIRSLRVADTLDPGKVLAGDQLEQVNLAAIQKVLAPNDLVDRISEIHGLLISKFTVDPKDSLALFHLAGTSLLFMQKISNTGRSLASIRPEYESLKSEWNAALKPLIHSALAYSKDIAPERRETLELEKIAIESKNLR